MRRFILTLDLKDDAALIAEYDARHKKVWPEIKTSIKESGVEAMNIYRLGNRLCMLMEVSDGFTFERKAKLDAENPIVQEWENLMSTFQQPLSSSANEKWQIMEEIFDLNQKDNE